MKTGTKGGSQVIRPKPQTKNQPSQHSQQQKPKLQKCPRKGGVKIGQSKQDHNKWRCGTCKRLHAISIYECTFCGDPRFPKEEKGEQQQAGEDRPLMAGDNDGDGNG